MATPIFAVRCLKNAVIARGTHEIVLERPEGFAYEAGQFVLWRVPSLDDPSDIQPRAYSIASSPEEDTLLFIIKRKDGGRASRWIEHALREGGSVDIQGPFGRFVLEHDGRPLMFLSTSTGIAPFRSHVRAALASGDTRPMDVVFGVRSEEDLFWLEEWSALCAKHPHVRLHVTLSQPSAAWKGLRGRIQQITPTILPDLSGHTVYVCGNPDMTAEVKKLCLETWGLQKQHLHVEGFI